MLLTTLSVLAGVCLYAAIHHLWIARHLSDHTHLLFALMCLAVTFYVLAKTGAYRAETAVELVTLRRWETSLGIVFIGLLPWFAIAYTGMRWRVHAATLTVLVIIMLAVNLILPYGTSFPELPTLETFTLPWGEQVADLRVHRRSAWHNAGWMTILLSFMFSGYACVRQYRHGGTAHGSSLACGPRFDPISETANGPSLALGPRLDPIGERRKALELALALVVFLAFVLFNYVVNLGWVAFTHTAEFGFIALVLIMSAALTSELRRSEEARVASEARFRALVEQSPFSIQMLSPEGKTQHVNPAWEKLWGVPAESLVPYNILQDQQLVEKGVMPYIEQGLAGTATDIPPIVYNPADNPVVRGPPRDRWIRAFIYPIKDARGSVREAVLIHEDVTASKRVEDAIRLIAAGVSAETGTRFFQQLVQSLAQLFVTDYAFIAVLDESDAQQVNTLAVCAHGAIAPDISYRLDGTPCANVMVSTCTYPRDVQALFPEDRLLTEMGAEGYIGTPLLDTQGKALGLIVLLDGRPLIHTGQMQEILEIFAARAGAELLRLRAENHIRRMAYQDYLTGLASRALLHERLSEMFHRGRLSGTRGALLLIDLDHFKNINDALSHDVGDEVLRAVARRLTEAVAECALLALLARVGGDEFVALMDTGTLDTPVTEHAARELAQRILDKLSSPLLVGERAFTLGASIGIVLFPENGESELDVMRHADMALYHAKKLGRSTIQFYSPGMQVAAINRFHLEEGLRLAIVNNELELYFQPQVDDAGRMIGAEALLRWHHPELGDIAPDTFIPVAEETGLIHSIGGWVFDQACARLADWIRRGVPFIGHLSVNVCPWQFARPDFVEQICGALTTHRVDPGRLMLELTETALLYDLEATIDKLKELRALGIRVSLDDFGTGYSSLAHLRDLPLDELKIDQTFIKELNITSKHPLVESMVAIGQHMGLAVIAEGVETQIQRDVLIQLGCEYFQGYLFARPLPERDFLQWLTHDHS